MKKKLMFKNFSIYFDQYLFISITLLSVMGLFFLYSASQGDKVVYETSKSAVVGLTRSFAQEFGKYNIRTNSVIPGSIATERQIKHWLTPKYKKLILDSQAIKRQLKPDDVASLVLFLSSDQSSGCTKQSFVVDGGIT